MKHKIFKLLALILVISLIFSATSCSLVNKITKPDSIDPDHIDDAGDKDNDGDGDTDEKPDDGKVDDDGDAEEQPHRHSYVNKVISDTYIISSATCASGAVYCYSCECGQKGSKTFVEGDPLEHVWNDPTCTESQVCELCGVKYGAPLGHDMSAATCTSPALCSRCDHTEGDVAEHIYDGVTCTVCGHVMGGNDGVELPIIPLD